MPDNDDILQSDRDFYRSLSEDHKGETLTGSKPKDIFNPTKDRFIWSNAWHYTAPIEWQQANVLTYDEISLAPSPSNFTYIGSYDIETPFTPLVGAKLAPYDPNGLLPFVDDDGSEENT